MEVFHCGDSRTLGESVERLVQQLPVKFELLRRPDARVFHLDELGFLPVEPRRSAVLIGDQGAVNDSKKGFHRQAAALRALPAGTGTVEVWAPDFSSPAYLTS